MFGKDNDIHVFSPVGSSCAGEMGSMGMFGHGAGKGEGDELLYKLVLKRGSESPRMSWVAVRSWSAIVHVYHRTKSALAQA